MEPIEKEARKWVLQLLKTHYTYISRKRVQEALHTFREVRGGPLLIIKKNIKKRKSVIYIGYAGFHFSEGKTPIKALANAWKNQKSFKAVCMLATNNLRKEEKIMVPSEPSDRLRMQLTVNIKKDGTVVLPVAQEIEYLTGMMGQDYHKVYSEPILLGHDCVLKYKKKYGGWVLTARKKLLGISM